MISKTIFACGEILDKVAICIEDDTREAMNWYKRNEMVANPDKFELIFVGLKEDQYLQQLRQIKPILL